MRKSITMQPLEHLYYFLVIFVHQAFCLPNEPNETEFDCEKECRAKDYTDSDYKPQECAAKCKDEIELPVGAFEDLVKEVSSLRLMVIILLSLVVLLILLFMITFVRKLKLKQVFRKLCPKKNKNSDFEKGTKDDKNKDAVIRVNYSSTTNSVLPIESPQMTSSVRRDSLSKACQEFPLETRRKRERMPSESTCPDESQIEHTGYDNLALSTSSINFHSRASSPSSPNEITSSSDTVDLSMNPLNTTTTTVQIDYGEESPSRSTIT